MPEAAVVELRKRLPKTDIYLMFGLTEAFRATYLPPGEVDRRPTSIGKAIPNAEIFVLNETGECCLPGEEGELVQRGAHVALGYWNDPEKTHERFRPYPFSVEGIKTEERAVFSGDRVKTDEDGFLYFIGRMDDMIKTSGYRVSPTEIEEILYLHPEVGHSAA
jgi:acyl-coenzyme A synthetase/AMP-(fatty) acid ligase